MADRLDAMARVGEALCGDMLWAREDGRALSRFVEELAMHARETCFVLEIDALPAVLREAMDRVAVRPAYGGHPRVAIYGLLESRGSRADLMICAGLSEGSWPARPATDPLLAPALLRALGIPGADFRIGLAAHDLAGAMGAPEVVLSRSQRDAAGPTIASRFLLRVQALLGSAAGLGADRETDLLKEHRDKQTIDLARALDAVVPLGPHRRVALHPRPRPMPSPELRRVRISVTGLDRLLGDPYQFYAAKILALNELEPLDAAPSPAWRGSLAHKILEDWHRGCGTMAQLMDRHLADMQAHPLTRALWRPRLERALEWVAGMIEADPTRKPVAIEQAGEIQVRGVTFHGKVDRIDALADGGLAIVDYKTGSPPKRKEVKDGFALQLGTLALMAREGAFPGASGTPVVLEYWSLGKCKTSPQGFGFVQSAVTVTAKQQGLSPEELLPEAERCLDQALDKWILGSEPFEARPDSKARNYGTYDHLMRLEEWITGAD